MDQSSITPSLAKNPPKQYTVIKAQPVEPIDDAGQVKGPYTMVFMSADSLEDIYTVYGTTAEQWATQNTYKIVESSTLPKEVLRNITFAECRAIGKMKQLPDVEASGCTVNYDQEMQRPLISYIHRTPATKPVIPAQLDLPYFGAVTVRTELREVAPLDV
jgi:hypothetical protein